MDDPDYDPSQDVQLLHSPVVPAGMRVVTYFGGYVVEYFTCDRDWEKAWSELHAQLRDRVRTVGANAVMGMEESADPFAVDGEARGIRLVAQGVAVRLSCMEA